MKQAAIRIYWWASLLAVSEAFLFFSFGLELRTEQVKLLLLFGWPAPILMYLCDRWLITRHVRGIDEVLEKQRAGQKAHVNEALGAYVQALNLPVLTLLRVLTIHAPAILVPATIVAWLANHFAGLGLMWWQFLVIWSLWPITAVPHAIMEYFLIERVVRQTLDQLDSLLGEAIMEPIRRASPVEVLRLLCGRRVDSPRIIRTSTGTQLAWLFFFVSLMPMCVLGASVLAKLSASGINALSGSPGSLRNWIICLIVLNAVINVAIVALASRRVHKAIDALLTTMRQILKGDLSSHWSPCTTDEFLDLGAGCNAMLLGLREREVVKETFGRFVSRDVADAVLSRRVPLGGELREVTVLFQDIRGFTSLSEKTPPQTLLRMLNTFFTEMVAAVEAHGGVVNQFTGDGVMVLFGVPAPQPDHASQAVRAALDMLQRLQAFNELRQEQGAVPIRIGIGIHTGEVVAGCVGPDTRLTYSVVGDAVNLASRVQDLTKELGVALLITEATAAQLQPEFAFGKRAVLTVRGKDQPVGVIEVRAGAQAASERIVAL